MKQIVALIFSLWLAPGFAAWPSIPFPPNTKIESLGNDVRLNGIPMRINRLLNREPADKIAAFYRQALAPDYIERPLLGDRLLSKGLGDYFLTVRIRPLGPDLTETLVSVSDARAAKSAAGRPLGFALPARFNRRSQRVRLEYCAKSCNVFCATFAPAAHVRKRYAKWQPVSINHRSRHSQQH